MTTIVARIHFGLPFMQAREYFQEGLQRVAADTNHVMRLTARVPGTPVDVSKNVVVECRADPDDADAWEVHWDPEPGGFYPSFDGRLSSRGEEDGTTTLVLSGSYTPPLGAAGAAFDHIFGGKITSDTAHEILLTLAAQMKAHYAFDEARRVFEQSE